MANVQPCPQKKQREIAPTTKRKKTILVADSDIVYCQLMSMLLENEGYAVFSSTDTAAAIGLISSKHFDFVIAEHSSNGVNGLSLLETAKLLRVDTPVLLMASVTEMDGYIEAMHLGACDYITKPIDWLEVKSIVSSSC
jgi:two-component system response regulator HydG